MARVNGITQFLPATHTTVLTLLRKHSPDGTTRITCFGNNCRLFRTDKSPLGVAAVVAAESSKSL